MLSSDPLITLSRKLSDKRHRPLAEEMKGLLVIEEDNCEDESSKDDGFDDDGSEDDGSEDEGVIPQEMDTSDSQTVLKTDPRQRTHIHMQTPIRLHKCISHADKYILTHTFTENFK